MESAEELRGRRIQELKDRPEKYGGPLDNIHRVLETGLSQKECAPPSA